jgi:hypothetical protein
VSLNISKFAAFRYCSHVNPIRLYILITIVITLYLLSGCGRTVQIENDSPPPPKRPIPETLSQAEQLFKQREDTAKLKQARDLISEVRQPDHRNYDVEWVFAKYSAFLGEKIDDEQKEKVF